MDLSKRSFNSSPVSDRQEEQSFLLLPQAQSPSEPYSFATNQQSAKSVCLLNATHPFKLKWDLFIALLTIWNCFYVPYAVAFMDYTGDFGLISVEVGTEVAYMVDIVLRIRTSYVDQTTAEEITDSIPILIHYIWSKNLGIDLLSAFPSELITLLTAEKDGFRYISLLKTLKLLRIGNIFSFLRVRVHMRLTLRLAQLLFVFMAYVHLIACLWFLLINTNQQYVPPALYVNLHPDLYERKEPLRQYAYSLYMSVYMLTAAEIGPRAPAERIFAGVAVLLGQLFQGYMFGEVAVVLMNLNKRTAEVAEARAATTTTMGNMQLSAELRGKLAEFMQYSLGISLKQAEFERFFKLLPLSLQKEVGTLTFERVIKLNHAIAGNNLFEISILHRLTTRYCQPEEAIIIQGDEATNLYFVAAGKCDVYLLDDKKQVKKMKSLSVGCHFGEIALLYPTLRTASVLAAGYVTLAVMSKQDFADLRLKYPAAETAFKQTALHYRDSWKRFVKNTLRRCPFFSRLRSSILNQLVYRLPTSRLSPYTYLLKEGTTCDQVTFIIEGNVQISLPINDQKLMIHYMQRQTSIAASLNSQNTIKSQVVKHSRFEVRLEAEDLGNGSVLCPNVVLLEDEKVSFAAQTTETTVVMTLTRDLLATLCKNSPK
jgi:CRP-like cAMP-binding protein